MVEGHEEGRREGPHLCSVPDDGRPGVAQFVSARPFVVVDQQEVVLSERRRAVSKVSTGKKNVIFVSQQF